MHIFHSLWPPVWHASRAGVSRVHQKTDEQTCNSQTFSLQFSYGIAELLCVCMWKCVYDECNFDCATLIARIGSNGAGVARLETCRFRHIPSVGISKRIFCILVCAHFAEFLTICVCHASRIQKDKNESAICILPLSLQPSYPICGGLVCMCVWVWTCVYRMSVFLVVFHLWAYTLIARIESSAARVARLETCRVYASFCRHIATNFRHLSLCTFSRVSDHVCLTCSRQGSHEFTKTRRKNLQFADLFSLQPSYQTCSSCVCVYDLRAYTLIAQIGSTVGGIARLEICRV